MHLALQIYISLVFYLHLFKQHSDIFPFISYTKNINFLWKQ